MYSQTAYSRIEWGLKCLCGKPLYHPINSFSSSYPVYHADFSSRKSITWSWFPFSLHSKFYNTLLAIFSNRPVSLLASIRHQLLRISLRVYSVCYFYFPFQPQKKHCFPLSHYSVVCTPVVHSSFAATWLPWCELQQWMTKKFLVCAFFCLGAGSV